MDTDHTTGIDPDMVAGDDAGSTSKDASENTADTASGGAPEEPDTTAASYGMKDSDSPEDANK